ncbi:MAG: hypothetical protein IIV55_01595 [Alistipes sp.]|nr:hypothetical protein [Alistipes sp.]MEE0864681.1 hypothetical protein [Alistipes sp.]
MTGLDKIWRRIFVMVVALIIGAASNITATPLHEISSHLNCYSEAAHSEPAQPTFELQRPTLGLTTTNQLSQASTPAVRTLPRTLRHVPRCTACSAAVRSIDSTTTASRYGLYNHKILFYTHPRHYYLNGLMRLII